MQVKERAVCLVLLLAFLPPLLAFSSWIRLDCIARTSLDLQTLLEEECLHSWSHWLQKGNAPLLLLAWGWCSHCSYTMIPQKAMIIEWILLIIVLVNYLDLSSSRPCSLFLQDFRLFSGFLDEGKWFIHDWRVVHMGGQRAGGAGCWTPGRCGALRPVKNHRCWCCPLGNFTTAPAQCPLSPEIFTKTSNLIDFFLFPLDDVG